ncbi:MAG: histidine phosphatase family protein [Spirochaetaceae bacterium]|nr:histidine phosphatase family protein [Spirochaetaceae bacterium]
MYSFIFMRHGRSLADDEKKYEGRYDSELTSVGVAQGKNTAMLFKEAKAFDRIITSPLLRAKKTATILSEVLNTPIEENELLLERDNGLLAGLTYQEASLKYPEPDKTTITRKYPMQSGENEIELSARALLCINYILSNDPGRYLIISHGNILNCIIKRVLNMPLESNVKFGLKDNGFVELEYHEDKNQWIFRRMVEGY